MASEVVLESYASRLVEFSAHVLNKRVLERVLGVFQADWPNSAYVKY